MKKIILFLLLVSNYGYAQNKYVLKGDKQMSKFSFIQAIEHYKKGLSENAGSENEIKLKIAECYRMLNQPKKSVRWYSEIIHDQSVIEPRHKLYYAMALCAFGDYNEANVWFKEYSADNPKDGRADNYIGFIKDLNLSHQDSLNCRITSSSINSPTADFAPAWYGDDGIIFISGRNRYSEKFNWDRSNYLEIYFCAFDKNNNLKEPVRLDGSVNTKLHEGPAALFNNGSQLIFTRNSYFKGRELRSRGGINKLQLYIAEREGGSEKARWTKIAPFPYNDREYSSGHPTVSDDGKSLYFISDRPGGFGGTDIYRCVYNGSTWGKPENLGPEVNTEGDEMFPFIFDNKVLYFASKGKGGFGGLDIFKVEIDQNGKCLPAKNLGYPINTKSDDFGLILDRSGASGYFSSNRNGGGDDDIYRFEMNTNNIQ